jgi:two-component system sensor histidine kinase QseC
MSIRRYLVLILLSIITLVTFLAAIQGYKASMEQASNLFD